VLCCGCCSRREPGRSRKADWSTRRCRETAIEEKQSVGQVPTSYGCIGPIARAASGIVTGGSGLLRCAGGSKDRRPQPVTVGSATVRVQPSSMLDRRAAERVPLAPGSPKTFRVPCRAFLFAGLRRRSPRGRVRCAFLVECPQIGRRVGFRATGVNRRRALMFGPRNTLSRPPISAPLQDELALASRGLIDPELLRSEAARRPATARPASGSRARCFSIGALATTQPERKAGFCGRLGARSRWPGVILARARDRRAARQAVRRMR